MADNGNGFMKSPLGSAGTKESETKAGQGKPAGPVHGKSTPDPLGYCHGKNSKGDY